MVIFLIIGVSQYQMKILVKLGLLSLITYGELSPTMDFQSSEFPEPMFWSLQKQKKLKYRGYMMIREPKKIQSALNWAIKLGTFEPAYLFATTISAELFIVGLLVLIFLKEEYSGSFYWF